MNEVFTYFIIFIHEVPTYSIIFIFVYIYIFIYFFFLLIINNKVFFFRMASFTNLQIPALEVFETNYLSQVLHAKMHYGLGRHYSKRNGASLQEKSKAMIFLCHHLHERLKAQCITVEDPLTLWSNLKERFDHQADIFLPNAKHEC